MKYLSTEYQIETAINELTQTKSLWLDTETADWQTGHPRLSLIQILANPQDKTGEDVILLDILDKPTLINLFTERIMKNPALKKIFHNASYDLKYLGGKDNAQNVTCTFRLAQKIGKNTLRTSNLKLKTLAAELCNFDIVDHEGKSDWGQRPLTDSQIIYATMDVVYLAHVHRCLLDFIPAPAPSRKILFPVAPGYNRTPTHPPLTLAQIRAAFHCPRLLYLSSHYGGESCLPTDSSEMETLSSLSLHYFIKSPLLPPLLEPPFEQLTPETMVKPLLNDLYQSFFFQYIQHISQHNPDAISQLTQTWQGLTRQITRWVEILIANRPYCLPSDLISQTFILLDQLPLLSLAEQPIQGSLPPILYHHPKQQFILLQSQSVLFPDISIACYLLQQHFQLPLKGLALWVLPKLSEITYSWQDICASANQAQSQFSQLQQWLGWQADSPHPPPPVLYHCSVCPQSQQCQQVFSSPPPNTARLRKVVGLDKQGEQEMQGSRGRENKTYPSSIAPPPTTPPSLSVEEKSLAKSLVNTLNAFGVSVDFVDAVAAPSFIRIKLKPQLGVKVASIVNRSDDLQVHLESISPPLIQPQAGYVSVDFPRQERQIAYFNQYYPQKTSLPTDELKIAIGINLDGQLREADLSDPNTCHFLVGGTTGSGKSEFLRSLLLSLLVKHPPQWLQIILVDPKRVTFPEFESCPWLYQPIIKDENDAISLMNELVEEMEKRYRRFEQARVADIQRYNQTQPIPLPRLVCIVDEYADLMAEKNTRTELEQSIKRLGAKARASGIHLIIATQRPDAKVVTPLIRSNLPGRIALKTASAVDSRIILGDNYTQAARLLGKGDLLFLHQSQLDRLQSLFINQLPAFVHY